VTTSLYGAVVGVLLGLLLGYVVILALRDEGLRHFAVPVGSNQEKNQLNYLLDGRANTVTELLFAPLLRGTTVSVAAEPPGQR
jgi:hypothetical protein